MRERELPPRDDLAAPLLRAPDERLAPELEDFARVDEAFFAPEERLLTRDEPDVELFARAVDLRVLVALRAPPVLRVLADFRAVERRDVADPPELAA